VLGEASSVTIMSEALSNMLSSAGKAQRGDNFPTTVLLLQKVVTNTGLLKCTRHLYLKHFIITSKLNVIQLLDSDVRFHNLTAITCPLIKQVCEYTAVKRVRHRKANKRPIKSAKAVGERKCRVMTT
jgi:hypothetical protein